MAFVIRDEKKPRVLPPAGSHIARCVWMIDLGSQEVNYPGSNPYDIRKIYISWELPFKKHEFKKENGMEPFMVGQEFTVSFGDKAKLRSFLEDWRGRAYDPKKLKEEGVDLNKLVEQPCRLNLVHGETKAGNPKCTIKSISPLDEGDNRCPPPHNVRICLVLTKEEFNIRDWLNTPKWLQDICKKSPEYQRLERLGYTVEGGEVQEEEPDNFQKSRQGFNDDRKAYEQEEANRELQHPNVVNRGLEGADHKEDSDCPF